MIRGKQGVTWKSVFVVVFAAYVAVSHPIVGHAATGDTEVPCFHNLPAGWKVGNSFVVSEDKTAEIAKRLGAPIVRLSNTQLNVNGRHIQVNVIEAGNESDALTLQQALAKKKSHPAFCVRKDLTIVEYVVRETDGVDLATRVSWELGFVRKPKEVRYRVTARLAAVEEADYMRLNELCNLFFEIEHAPNAEVDAAIADAARGFRFGNRLTLRAPSENGTPSYTLTPTPVKTSHSGGTVTYEFENLPQSRGVPYVSMTAEVTVSPDGMTSAPKDIAVDTLLCATRFWPVDDPQVKTLATEITQGCNDDREKVNALLAWLTPGKHIQFGGPVNGSRYGVQQVLRQGFGCCWDFSDCFVTFCRAAGIPCRQVGGWFYGGEGHGWAEVLLEGPHWLQVDPTGGGRVACGIYHIPYFTTEDGAMPILAVSMPRIEVLASAAD